ncbi:MAG: hypothetical protein P4M00_04410 [Azospirillaceae bacterium]|nr:hypothetical protein [Azospirillaceae bacterium]
MSQLEPFLAFSAEVTAFPIVELQGTGQAESYLQTVEDIVGTQRLDRLLVLYQSLPLATREDIRQARADRLRRDIFGSDELGPIARNIIKLWYSGTWYELPSAWTEAYGPAPQDVTFVVAPSSYVEGLLWTAIGAHPAGAKAPGYASWQWPPHIPPFAGDPAATPR